ncbi:hypothetical protein DFH06DRAFT_1425567 [Mycena polygramma]|nr:hypothetical protein DFH06DRAFT_1425567 [Mycena polygramma]
MFLGRFLTVFATSEVHALEWLMCSTVPRQADAANEDGNGFKRRAAGTDSEATAVEKDNTRVCKKRREADTDKFKAQAEADTAPVGNLWGWTEREGGTPDLIRC